MRFIFPLSEINANQKEAIFYNVVDDGVFYFITIESFYRNKFFWGLRIIYQMDSFV